MPVASLINARPKESLVGFLAQIIPHNSVQKAKMTKNIDTNNVFKKLSHPSHSMNLDITVFEDYIPPFTCILENNYTIGCDSDSLYVFNEHLRVVRLITLIDALETTRSHCKKTRLINISLKQNLNLNINAMFYELSTKKLYLLITVQNQQCFLNIFDVEMSWNSMTTNTATSTDTIEYSTNSIRFVNICIKIR